MKANSRFTALEILTAAGIENPIEKIGKVRVRIAGIAGITKPDHVVRIQPGTTEIDVIVGDQSVVLSLEGDNEEVISSEGSQKAVEARKERLNKQAEAIRKAKEAKTE